MRFVIIGNDGNIIPNSSIDAIDVNDARDMAMDIVPSGKFKDVAAVDSKEYQQAVQARGNVANVELEQTIKQKREKEMETAGGLSPIIAPYTTRSQVAGDADKAKSEDERKVIAMGEASKDIWSLPGRVLTSVLPWGREIIGTDASGEPKRESYGSAVGRTAEDEGTNVGGSIARSPATAVAIPLSILAGPAVGAMGISSTFLAGGAEGGLVGAGTSAFNYATDEDYTVADAAIETFLSAGIGSLIKGGSAKSIEKAKNMIRSSGNFTQKQIDYIYSKLGITRGGTEQKLSKAVPERIGDVANIEYGDINPITGGRSTFVTEDIAGNIAKDVAKAYQESIKMGRIHSGMNITEKRAKEAILKEFNESMDELSSDEYAEAGRYLYRLLEEAKYFYQKDPELGQILIDKIEEVYKLNYALMENAPMNIKLAPMSDLTSKFGEVSATSQYLRSQPKPVNVFESGGVGGFGTLAPNMTPERLSNVGGALQALRMPSIVATQDVLGNTAIPEYLNLNQMRSK